MRRGWRLAPRDRAWLEVAREHPRHVVLFALAAGLALGPALRAGDRRGAVAAAAAVAGRRGLAVLAAGAVLLGAVVADARLAALDAGVLRGVARPALGGERRRCSSRCASTGSHASARVWLDRLDEAAVVRLRVLPRLAARRRCRRRRRVAGARAAAAAVAAASAAARGASSGRVAPLGRYDAYQRRRGAHAALEVDRLARDGRRRAVVSPGRWTRCGGAPRPGSLGGWRRRRRALLAGWCSARTSGCPRRSGRTSSGRGSRICSRCRARTSSCSRCSCSARGWRSGCRCARGSGRRSCSSRSTCRWPAAARRSSARASWAPRGSSRRSRGGRASRWYALGLAAAVTLAINPRASGEPGWQLSFAAVAGPARARARAGARRCGARGCPGPLADAVAVTAAATLATAPLMALHFEQVSLASLPANLVAAPAVAPVMWLGMGSIALAQVAPVLCAPLNALNGSLLAYLRVGRARRRAAARGRAAGADRRPGRPGRVVRGRSGACSALAGRAWRRAGRAAAARAAGGARRRRRCAALALVVLAPRPGAAAPGRARRLVPRRRPGRRDAAAARRRVAAGRHRAARRPDPAPARARPGVQRLDALLLTHARGRPRGHGARHRPRVPPAARARRRGRVADAGAARAARRAACAPSPRTRGRS